MINKWFDKMKGFDLYERKILKWTGIGLIIRLMLMPFTMHSHDLFFINYFPMVFVKAGIWDPYGFINIKFPDFVQNSLTYYGPAVFIIMSIANFIFIKCFNAVALVRILQLSGTMMFKGFTAIDYVHIFPRIDLLASLFLMKSPYLIFDFLIGAILLKLAASKNLAIMSYKLWMLNIVVLHSVYMVGQIDLVLAFVTIAALYAAVKKKPYLSIILLSLGGATKLFPYILLFPACLLLGRNWKKRFSLLFVAAAVTFLLYLPFYLSSGNAVLGIFMTSQRVQYSGIARWILLGIFAVWYSFTSVNAVKDSRRPEPERKLLFYFLTVGLLTCAVIPIQFRYLVFITPLLALIIPQQKRFAIFILFIILMLAFLRLFGRDVQWDLFAPLNPEYFANLATVHEIIGQFIDIEIVLKIICRALLLCFFVASGWIWRIKLNNEQKTLRLAGGQVQR